MRYSEKLSKKRDFNREIIDKKNSVVYIHNILNRRYNALHHDKGISKESIRETIFFDQYICRLVEKSKKQIIYDYELLAIKEYIKKINKDFFKAKIVNGQSMLEIEGLASKNEFAIFSSSMEQLKKLFKNDSEISNILNIIDNKYNMLIDNVIRPSWQKYEQGNQLTDAELKILLRYFIANCPSSSKKLRKKQELFFKNNLRNLLIDDNGKNLLSNKNGLLMLEFICKYAVCRNLFDLFHNEEDDVYDKYFIYCNDMQKGEVYAYANVDEICFGYHRYGTTGKSSKLEGLCLLLMVIFHETRHVFQFHHINKKNINEQLLSISAESQLKRIFASVDPNEYTRNYFTYEIEHDANRNALFKMGMLLESLNTDKLKKMIKEVEAERAEIDKKHRLTIRKDAANNTYISSDYKFKTLDDIVKKNLDLVDKYNLLKILYNSNGTPKNPLELLTVCNLASLSGYSHGIDFILEYFSYRNTRNIHLFEQVLNEKNTVRKELMLDNMFVLFRAARNEINAYYSQFEYYMRNPDKSINTENLEVIKRKINQYIELMKKIFPVLSKSNYGSGSLYNDFNRHYKLDEYVNKYENLISKISTYKEENPNKK